jgi:hypothetical protein
MYITIEYRDIRRTITAEREDVYEKLSLLVFLTVCTEFDVYYPYPRSKVSKTVF